jgi:hypothetical protein
MSPYNEAEARLGRLVALWRQLKHAPTGSQAYEALVKQIRAESDAYKALVDAHVTQVKPWEPND